MPHSWCKPVFRSNYRSQLKLLHKVAEYFSEDQHVVKETKYMQTLRHPWPPDTTHNSNMSPHSNMSRIRQPFFSEKYW